MKNNTNIMRLSKKILLTILISALFSPGVNADTTSQNINDTLVIQTNNGMWAGTVIDDNYKSYWYTENAASKYIKFESSEPISHIYVCYMFKPTELIIQTSDDGQQWLDAAYEYESDYYHVSYSFDTPAKIIRIMGTEQSAGKFGVAEVKVYSEGQLPDSTQKWAPTHDNPDMLLFSAHPDDEAVFFAGLIPYYSTQRDKKVTVVYMTASDPYRRSESLNYLWSMNQDTLPVFAGFPDVYEKDSYSYIQSVWGKKDTIDYMVSIIREKKPDVIVSHDLNGEYGHGAHMFTALCLTEAVLFANDATYHPESYETYDTHATQKLYLHLYDKNQVTLDVLDEPLSEFGDLSAMDLARMNIGYYASQLKYEVVRVHDKESRFSSYNYGLVHSTVGDDINGNDMFENIELPNTPTPEPTTTPSPTPQSTSTPIVTPIATPTATAEPVAITHGPVSKLGAYILVGIICCICIWLCIMILIIRKK